MATITTYLLVWGTEENEVVRSHQLFDEHDFEQRETHEAGQHQLPVVKFALEKPLEEAVDLEEDVRDYSTTVPDANVLLCTVEERFDQVEQVQLVVFRDGKQGGGIEHGHFFQVGTG